MFENLNQKLQIFNQKAIPTSIQKFHKTKKLTSNFIFSFPGRIEWNGDWSSSSSLWKTVKDARLRRELLDREVNGEYW
jgi:hypothetical protein